MAHSIKEETISDFNLLKSKYNVPEPYHAAPRHAAHRPNLLQDAYQEARQIAEDFEQNREAYIEQQRRERHDLRGLRTFTIDPEDAKDFDDAISVQLEDGGTRVYVSIADVAHYVEEDSAIDQAAQHRGVTFYLGEQTRHMLPEPLAADVCSLVPEEDRLAHTVELLFGPTGRIEEYDLYKSLIRSDERLSYPYADDIIDGNSDAAWDVQGELPWDLRVLDDLTADLREDRWDKSLILNEKNSASSRIIEELMLKANQTIAHHLQENGLPGLYRVEPRPHGEWTRRVEENLHANGVEREPGWLAGRSDTHAKEVLNELFENLNGAADEARIATVTELPRAEYAADRRPHFGLGFTHYAHFTSPIRRYPDLLLHRILDDSFSKDKTYLNTVASSVSQQEKNADRANAAWTGC